MLGFEDPTVGPDNWSLSKWRLLYESKIGGKSGIEALERHWLQSFEIEKEMKSCNQLKDTATTYLFTQFGEKLWASDGMHCAWTCSARGC